MAGIGIDRRRFMALAREYQRRFRVPMMGCDALGRIVHAVNKTKMDEAAELCQARRQAISEAMRWGEPTAQMAMGNVLVWAVPLLHNHELLGGLVATIPERRLFAKRDDQLTFDTHAACVALRKLAEETNLTNAALLRERRREYRLEQMRAEGIASFKQAPRGGIRAMYLLDEPALLAAIRSGNREQARSILNRLLAAMHHHAGDRLEVIKSFFMELVVTMTRMAVEAGGAPQELLGDNYKHLSELARIDSEETLAPWLHDRLEELMDALKDPPMQTQQASVSAAVAFMSKHFASDITRDDAARAAHLSSAHFSRLFKRQTGQTFTVALNQLRVDRAAELLLRSPLSLKEIALESGFAEQSYFTKVFRKMLGQTPQDYRKTQLDRQNGSTLE